MKLLLLLTLTACERDAPPPKAPDTVILVDELWGKERATIHPTATAQEFPFGCTIAAVKDYTAIRCPDRDLFVRFHCRDLPGPDHALEFVVKDEGFKLYCR